LFATGSEGGTIDFLELSKDRRRMKGEYLKVIWKKPELRGWFSERSARGLERKRSQGKWNTIQEKEFEKTGGSILWL